MGPKSKTLKTPKNRNPLHIKIWAKLPLLRAPKKLLSEEQFPHLNSKCSLSHKWRLPTRTSKGLALLQISRCSRSNNSSSKCFSRIASAQLKQHNFMPSKCKPINSNNKWSSQKAQESLPQGVGTVAQTLKPVINPLNSRATRFLLDNPLVHLFKPKFRVA
jgi:hypothetical protein